MSLSRLVVPALAALACAAPAAAPAAAQSGQPLQFERVPTDVASMQASFAPVVRRTAPAVVNVLTVQRQARNPWFEMFGGQGETQRQGQFRPTGSGVIVRPDGIIVTNNHVVENAERVRVALADRRELDAEVLLRDPRADLAVLRIRATDQLPALNLDTAQRHEVGDLVLAIGNPFGVGQTVTSGIVSATNRSGGDITSFIQTDAAINPGNSGGPLVDMDGDVIGINTAILSRSGTSSGVGFAVPAALVRQAVDTAVGGATRVVRPYLGVGSQPVTQQVAESLGLTRPEGVLVRTISEGSPAARAGLRIGDVIVSANGVPVNDPGALNFQIATQRPGDVLPLQIRREGRFETIRPRLEAPRELPKEERTLAGQHPLMGVSVANLSADLIYNAGVNPLDYTGVLVLDPGRGPARRAGLQRGDLVTEVNDRSISTVRELETAMNTARSWRLTVRRGGREGTLEF